MMRRYVTTLIGMPSRSLGRRREFLVVIIPRAGDCPTWTDWCVERLRQPPDFCRASVSDAKVFHRNALQLISALRCYPIRERVGMKVGVITQTVPRTIFLGSLADGIFLTFGIIIPGIVSSDGEKCPVGSFQVLH